MNINQNTSEINNVFEFVISSCKEKIQPEEREWIKQAITDIHNPDKSIKLEDRISRQVDGLHSFTSDQIIHLVNMLHSGIKKDNFDGQVQNYFCQKVAALALQNKIPIDRLFMESVDKNFAIKVIVKQVNQGKLDSLKAAEHLLQCGLDPNSLEIQEALVEIAKLAAQENGEHTSQYIRNYGIDATKPVGQKALIEIAKLAVEQNPIKTSAYIQYYGIDKSTNEGQQALIEIAKLAAVKSGWGISFYILNYGIDKSTQEGQKALIEIAVLAAQQDIGHISEYIGNYGIDVSRPEGKQALIEIAKLAAQNGGGKTSQYIRNYGINASTLEGQQVLIEIAKLAAQHNGWGTSQFIKNYGINASTSEGQNALIEIAKLAAQQNGWGTSKGIKNYGINASTSEGQQALIEIAKLAAQQDIKQISEYIGNYGIDVSNPEGKQALIEIAKLAAQQKNSNISKYIKNYDIDASTSEGQQVLIEIAKHAAQENLLETILFIQNYSLDTESVEGKQRYLELIQILCNCLFKQIPKLKFGDFIRYFEFYVTKCKESGIKSYYIDIHQFDAPIKQLRAGDLPGAFQESLGIAAVLFEMGKDQLQWVQDRMSSIKDNFEKDKIGENEAVRNQQIKAEQADFLEQWMILCTLFASRRDLKQLFKENGQLFEGVFNTSPSLRNRMMDEVVAALIDQKSLFVERLKAELLKASSVVQKIAVLPRDLRSIVMETFLRGCHDAQAEKVKHLRDSFSDTLPVHAQLACFILAEFPIQGSEVDLVLADIAKERIFRDAKYQQPLLAALVAIEKSSLPDAAKIKLLKGLCSVKNASERIQALKLIMDILNFKGESYLGETIDLNGLKATLERLFIDKCKVKLDNFGALYEDTVGKWRNKQALLTYAGKHVGYSRALPYFQLFLTTVLQGNFSQTRYAVENNPHLDQIKKSHPKVFEAWQKPVSMATGEIASKDIKREISVEARIIDNLKQAVENRHLGDDQQETIFPILNACRGNWGSLNSALKSIEQQLGTLSNRRLNAEELSQKQRLQLQKHLLEMMMDSSNLENKLNVLKSIQIKGLEKALAPFYQDLEDSAKLLRSSQITSPKEMMLVDSDDPNHFLLMGTEVLNSCQNVDGSASLNVGLLGYALDGKHRLALVCDPLGQILARSVLRLLIDVEGHPVLFQERVYVADANPEYPALLRKIALEKAKLLRVPLVVSPSDFENEQAKPYDYALEAKDKPVPFEYVDALNGLQSGSYRIGKCLQINDITPGSF